MAGILLPAFEQNRWVLKGQLAKNPDGLAAIGRWGRLGCARPFTVTIAPLGTNGLISQVSIYVANQIPEPPQATAVSPTPPYGSPLGTPITVSMTLTYDLPFEWIMAIVASGAQPTAVDLAAG